MKLLNIAFQGGTHGNFLRYFIDKFSKKTPELHGDPFTKNNTSHKELPYCELIERYHPTKSKPYFLNSKEPHLLITIDPNDLLYIERWVTFRAGDYKIDIRKDEIILSDEFIKDFELQEKFLSLYNINLENQKSIPKFIFRDHLKLGFLDVEKNGFIKNNNTLIKYAPKNCFLFPVSAFWDEQKFFNFIEKLNRSHNLELDIQEDSRKIYKKFLNGLPFHSTKSRALNIIESIQNNKTIDISEIDTAEQAYISAWLEKNYDFITVPCTNMFFANTKDIIEWLKFYPQHYKAMNPNLPTFNNIPNPFYLHNLKK